MKYFIKGTKNNKFSVIEYNTKNVIKTYGKHQQAHKLVKLLNSGCGFDGEIPSFIAEPIFRDKII